MKKETGLYRDVYLYQHMLEEFFRGDDDITVCEFDVGSMSIDIECDDRAKFAVLQEVIKSPTKMEEDGEEFEVSVLYTGSAAVCEKDFKTLFADNKHFSRILESESPMSKMSFVLFKNKTLQYASDDISSPWGITTTTAEDVAKRIFDCDVPFATESSSQPAECIGDFCLPKNYISLTKTNG